MSKGGSISNRVVVVASKSSTTLSSIAYIVNISVGSESSGEYTGCLDISSASLCKFPGS